MKSAVVKDAKKYITQLLEKGLTADHRYHNLKHTLSVVEASLKLGDHYRLEEEDLEILTLAALFHDAGFTKRYHGHEEVSKEIAANFLKEARYPPQKIEKILGCIEVTKLSVEPRTLLQKIIKDADFNNFSNGSYIEKSEKLRHEWKVFCGLEMEDVECLENNIQFWKKHRFFTGQAQSLFGEEKRASLKILKKRLEKKTKKKKKTNRIADSRSAQMMFKTSLRNHIDLTNIADNKSNIMLSINALIITITMPLLATNIKGNMFLLIPASILLVTCVISIIFATLATRPIKTIGNVEVADIGKEPINLFFFGNFYKMSLDEYRKGMQQVLGDELLLEDSIVLDLFFLGKALGVKFRRLRICYSVFMVGMTLTVIAFAIAFFYTL